MEHGYIKPRVELGTVVTNGSGGHPRECTNVIMKRRPKRQKRLVIRVSSPASVKPALKLGQITRFAIDGVVNGGGVWKGKGLEEKVVGEVKE